jgi:Tfp pilus assembly protein PilF
VYLLPSTRPRLGAPSDAPAKALAAVTRALELDDSLPEAHISRAGLHFFHDRDLVAAEREFKRAIELNPGYPTARQWYAFCLRSWVAMRKR